MIQTKDASAAVLNGLIEALAEKVAERLSRERNVGNGTQRTARLLTLKEAAAYLSLSLSTVKNMLVSSELRVVSRGGRRMVDINDLDVWIERHKG
jgi:excisionase family DNA binding protein